MPLLVFVPLCLLACARFEKKKGRKPPSWPQFREKGNTPERDLLLYYLFGDNEKRRHATDFFVVTDIFFHVANQSDFAAT